MKKTQVGTGAVLGRRLARELTPEELALVGGGGEKEKTGIVDDCKSCNDKKCEWKDNTTPQGTSDEVCTF